MATTFNPFVPSPIETAPDPSSPDRRTADAAIRRFLDRARAGRLLSEREAGVTDDTALGNAVSHYLAGYDPSVNSLVRIGQSLGAGVDEHRAAKRRRAQEDLAEARRLRDAEEAHRREVEVRTMLEDRKMERLREELGLKREIHGTEARLARDRHDLEVRALQHRIDTDEALTPLKRAEIEARIGRMRAETDIGYRDSLLRRDRLNLDIGQAEHRMGIESDMAPLEREELTERIANMRKERDRIESNIGLERDRLDLNARELDHRINNDETLTDLQRDRLRMERDDLVARRERLAERDEESDRRFGSRSAERAVELGIRLGDARREERELNHRIDMETDPQGMEREKLELQRDKLRLQRERLVADAANAARETEVGYGEYADDLRKEARKWDDDPRIRELRQVRDVRNTIESQLAQAMETGNWRLTTPIIQERIKFLSGAAFSDAELQAVVNSSYSRMEGALSQLEIETREGYVKPETIRTIYESSIAVDRAAHDALRRDHDRAQASLYDDGRITAGRYGVPFRERDYDLGNEPTPFDDGRGFLERTMGEYEGFYSDRETDVTAGARTIAREAARGGVATVEGVAQGLLDGLGLIDVDERERQRERVEKDVETLADMPVREEGDRLVIDVPSGVRLSGDYGHYDSVDDVPINSDGIVTTDRDRLFVFGKRVTGILGVDPTTLMPESWRPRGRKTKVVLRDLLKEGVLVFGDEELRSRADDIMNAPVDRERGRVVSRLPLDEATGFEDYDDVADVPRDGHGVVRRGDGVVLVHPDTGDDTPEGRRRGIIRTLRRLAGGGGE